MRTIFVLLAAAMARAAYAGPAADALAGAAGADRPAVQPAAPRVLPSTAAPNGRINIFPTQADIYRWYRDGSLSPAPDPSWQRPVPPAPAGGGPARAYNIRVASAGGQVNVEISRSTAAPGSTPLVSVNGGRTGNMFSGTVLLGDTVQMSGLVNVQSGIQIQHTQHFTVLRIPFGNGAKFMILAGNGISFRSTESELAVINTAEAGFRADVPLGGNTTMLRFGLTGGPGVSYQSFLREGGRETSVTGTVMGTVSIINW